MRKRQRISRRAKPTSRAVAQEQHERVQAQPHQVRIAQRVPNSAPAVQAKVGLEDQRKRVTTANYAALGVNNDPKLSGLITQGIEMTFKNAHELNEYMAGRTDHIGYTPHNQWVRMEPGDFYVLGEAHNSPGRSATEIIDAVGTERYMHEGFNETNDYFTLGGAKQATALDASLSPMMGQVPHLSQTHGSNSPVMEDAVFKAIGFRVRFIDMASEIKADVKNLAPYLYRPGMNYSGEERMAHYLRQLILLSKDVSTWGQPAGTPAGDLGAYYLANSSVLDAMETQRATNPASTWVGDMLPNTNASTLSLIEDFANLSYDFGITYVTKHALTELASGNLDAWELIAHANQMQAQKGTFPYTGATLNHPVNMSREWYMMEKLKQGKPNGYLLAGVGELHLPRLQTLALSRGQTTSSIADQWVNASTLLQNSTNSAASAYSLFSP